MATGPMDLSPKKKGAYKKTKQKGLKHPHHEAFPICVFLQATAKKEPPFFFLNITYQTFKGKKNALFVRLVSDYRIFA
ncbi:hypothetical protein M2146_001087 [Lachnospiraceae bacterium PF1-22]